MDTHVEGGHSTPEQNKTLFSVLAYFGPLVILSYFLAGKDPFVKFHVKQGLVLFGIELIVSVVARFFWPLWMLIGLVNLCTLILSIVGIINAAQHHQKELPVVGHLANSIHI
jgi:uncharacterized membrane protein